MTTILTLLVALGLAASPLSGQIGLSHTSLESKVAAADQIVRAKVVKVTTSLEIEQRIWLTLDLVVTKTLKGKPLERTTFTLETHKSDGRWLHYLKTK